MKTNIRIAMAEDHVFIREGIISVLKGCKDITVIFDVSNGRELLNNLKIKKVDIILLDIDMPVMDGMEALMEITLLYPDIKVIMLTIHFKDDYILDFIKNGAKAFLSKENNISEIVKAIHTVYTEGFYYDEKVSQVMADALQKTNSKKARAVKIRFTKRELEVLNLFRLNSTNAEVAVKLNLSLRTIEGYRLNLLQKTETKNLKELIEWAFQNM